MQPTSPLQIRDYRFFWLTRITSVVATSAMVVAIGYQLYDVARSDYHMSIPQAAFQLGLLGLVQFIPLMLLTPIAGVVADRFDRRIIGGLAIGVDMTIALVLAFATSASLLSLPLLFSLAAMHGTARVFIGPALGSIAPNIVPVELMPKAIAINSIAWQAGSVAGPAAGGFLFASYHALPYWVAAGLLALACLCIAMIRKLPPPRGSRDVHPIRQIIDGFTYVWNERFLLGCVTLDLFAVLLGGATALLPVFARDILHVGPEGLGQMRAAPALGAAIVALFMAWKPLARNVGARMLWAVAVYGAATLGFGLSRWFLLSLLFLTLLGAADMVSVFIRSSLVQLNTPDEVRGRVSAISGLAVSASNELGEMQSGVAAALLGATGAVVFGGVGAIVITVMWAWLFPELIRARTFAPQYRQRETAA
ncbi:MAG: MFS transporter [Novosphingobium sp.]|jgi:MFS family permease|nr:MFS transporter [Novosphingobium sp.]